MLGSEMTTEKERLLPWLIASSLVAGYRPGIDILRGISVEAMRKAMIERSPLKRMVTAEDIVDATVFFASDMARKVSGQVLAVNAGELKG